MSGPKTIEAARELPEMNFQDLDFGPEGFDKDDIVFFIDTDGRAMRVESTSKGFVKVLI